MRVRGVGQWILSMRACCLVNTRNGGGPLRGRWHKDTWYGAAHCAAGVRALCVCHSKGSCSLLSGTHRAHARRPHSVPLRMHPPLRSQRLHMHLHPWRLCLECAADTGGLTLWPGLLRAPGRSCVPCGLRSTGARRSYPSAWPAAHTLGINAQLIVDWSNRLRSTGARRAWRR